MAQLNDLKTGMVVRFKGDLYVITQVEHVKPGKGSAFARCKLKNIKTGAVIENTWKASDTIDDVDVEKRKMQYLYNDGSFITLMDVETYDQYQMAIDDLGDMIKFMKENIEVDALIYEGNVIAIELPFFVDLKVVETEPGVKGDTATSATKPATLETGLVVQVPLFIEEGETIRIDTRTGKYVERVNK